MRAWTLFTLSRPLGAGWHGPCTYPDNHTLKEESV